MLCAKSSKTPDVPPAVAAGEARSEALRHAEELAKKLQAEQRKQRQQVSSEITEVKQAADTAHAKIADVSSEVGTVRSEIASTKSELDKTIAELKSVRGDLGVQSGLIATNGKELAALRDRGDRNYYEFKLAKSKQMQRVGDVDHPADESGHEEEPVYITARG